MRAFLLAFTALSFLFPFMSPVQVQSALQSPLDRERGVALYKEGQAEEAVKVLKKVVKQSPRDELAWEALGLALIQTLDLKSAIKSFETAISLNPSRASAHVGLSYALLMRNKTREAMRAAQVALDINPGLADAYYIVAVINRGKEAFEEALQATETAINLKPHLAMAHLVKSQVILALLGDVSAMEETSKARISRYVAALEALERFFQLNPNHEVESSLREQLESLRFYVKALRSSASDEAVYWAKEVSTKAKVLSKPLPDYTEVARNHLVSGTVILRVVFSHDGTVKHPLVIRGLPDGLTENSIKAALKIRFNPAQLDGRPVSSIVQVEYNFEIY